MEVRDANHPFGFKKVHFNSNMDAVESEIAARPCWMRAGRATSQPCASRSSAPATTSATLRAGSGDLDGPDIADCIRTDWIAEDFAGITEGNVDQLRYDGRVNLKVLSQWVGMNADNDRGERIKVIPVVHSAQAIQPGSVMQALVNNGAGAGYYRPLDVHQAYRVPLTLHVTPTLAAALQWAKVDPSQGPASRMARPSTRASARWRPATWSACWAARLPTT